MRSRGEKSELKHGINFYYLTYGSQLLEDDLRPYCLLGHRGILRSCKAMNLAQ